MVKISQKGLGDWQFRGGPMEPGPRRLGGDLIKFCPEECPGPPIPLPPAPPSGMAAARWGWGSAQDSLVQIRRKQPFSR